ncbi:MAG: Flp pilus assembly complex ATPase component TadA [Nitrospirae bacterium]|nr:Flp pilus assembly complex ATPase component TadA [Nitrospirota bacterium]
MPINRAIQGKLGQILVDAGRLTADQLSAAVERQRDKEPHKQLGTILVEQGIVSEAAITEALGVQFNLAVVDLTTMTVDPEVIRLVPELLALRLGVIPLFLVEKELTVAIADPTEIQTIDFLARETRCTIQPVLAPRTQIAAAHDLYYLDAKMVNLESGDLHRFDVDQGGPGEVERLRAAGKEIPIIKIVDQILNRAVEEGASDIHFEPGEKKFTIRYRVDGLLHETLSFSPTLRPAITSRLKILSSLDISERQKPQDGRIELKVGSRDLDLRVSTLPTAFGEKVVLRILDRANILMGLKDLGFSAGNLDHLLRLIRQPYGIILVTGPTGSGKSTTLYAALNTVKSPEVNIVTVEDPIEYQLNGINQVQVNLKKDLNFATILRSVLRQDPDIIMVGEIRDPDTGAMATEAALTGHLVFSTLHTNDAAGAVTRLIEMGIEPFLLAPSLLGVVAQRLVRKVCTDCREFYQPRPAELERLDLVGLDGEVVFPKAKGCAHCKQRGYRGRTGVHEVLVIDDVMRQMISEKLPQSTLVGYAAQRGFIDMRIDGIKKVVAGITTVEEVLRVSKG